MSQSNTQWFIEPLNPQTNEFVATLLALDGDDTIENFSGITDAQGIIHQVWQVQSKHIETLRASRPNYSWLKFKVWKRDTNYGVLRRAEFMENPKRRYPAKAKKAKAKKSALSSS